MRQLIILVLVLCANFAHALNIVVDYTYDTGFFTGNADARTAVEKAATDIGAALTGSLSAVTTNIYSSTVNGKTVTIDWSLFVDNPSNPGTDIEISSFGSLFPANTIRIFAGGTALSGNTLGKGGPSGAGYGLSYVDDPSSGPAMISAANKSNTALGRGDGPVIGAFEENSVPGTSATLSYGAIAGKLSIDNDTNWHFDINTLPQPGEFDLYTVALHELMHAIGFGTAASWDADVSGTNWLGSTVMSLTGGGTDVLSPDQAHIKSGTMSPGINSGIPQLTVMDPGLSAGVRKELTDLDIAFLKDIGFQTITVPEPSTIMFAVTAVFAFGAFRCMRRRA